MRFMDIPTRSRWRKATRTYELSLQRDLWGHWCLLRAWGATNRAGGRCTTTPFDSLTEAITAYDHAQHRRQRRGYHLESHDA